MTDTIYIEPAHEHRPAFSLWGLKQAPPLQTASAHGWEVPLDLYPSIPAELLEGAAVDGYPYGVAAPQPAQAATDPASEPVEAATDPAPQAETPKPRRKRAARKSTTQRYAETETTAVLEATGRLSGIDGDSPGWGADA